MEIPYMLSGIIKLPKAKLFIQTSFLTQQNISMALTKKGNIEQHKHDEIKVKKIWSKGQSKYINAHMY